MNELKIFSSTEFGELGVMLIDGKEYFPATQCAEVLGYKNPKDAIIRHCKGVVKHDLPTNGGKQTVNYIPEGDLYRLIVSSKLPQAEKFERWVFDEVLPDIRQSGCYIGNVEELIANTATAVAAAVVNQLVPILIQGEARKKPERKRRRSTNQQLSIIEQLPQSLRNHVDYMLESGAYSCQSVANFLIANGVQISQMSVNKYGHKFIWNKEEA